MTADREAAYRAFVDAVRVPATGPGTFRNVTLALADLHHALADNDREPAWAAITIEMLSETDYKSAGRIFGTIENYTVRLKLKDQPYRDARIVNASALEERVEGASYDGGFDYVLLDDDGNTISDELFVAYEDIEAIGVY